MEQTLTPRLTVVVLTWDGLEESRRCILSVRENTDVPYELVIVDNGSRSDAAAFAHQAADRAILNPTNRGFAPGMNQGLAAATGEFIAFCNNDTQLPIGWASTLLEDFEEHPQAGIVIPAVTAAGNPRTVRSAPGTEVEVLLPFGEFPSGVIYVMRREVAQQVGGWNERYPVASAEDLDLCFTVWANDLSVVFDQRILVRHTSQATVSTKLDDHRELYRSNLELFLDRWASAASDIPRLEGCDPDRFEANLARAATAVHWIRRLLETRDELQGTRRQVRTLEARCARLEQRASSPSIASPRRRGLVPLRHALSPIVRRLRRRYPPGGHGTA